MADQVFDFIIVGGGTAGCVLASRLSVRYPHRKILVIEAGPVGDPRIAPTLGLVGSIDLVWGNTSIPQASIEDKVLAQPQGKVLGGSSAVNYQIWTRGSAADFDAWAAHVKDPRWSWESMLPYFAKSETFFGESKSPGRGDSGPIKAAQVTSCGRPRAYPLREAVASMYEEAGVKHIADGNAGTTIGYSESQWSAYDGVRQWAASCYPRGENVTTWCETQATKLLFRGDRVTGVEVLRPDGTQIRISARTEVLLCSGAQGSPKLLLLSGIGPTEQLQKHAISQIVNLPVGQNYSDHPLLATYWHLNKRGFSFGDVENMVSATCDWTAGMPTDWIAFHRHDDAGIWSLADAELDSDEIERFTHTGRAQTESIVLYGHFDFTGTAGAPPEGSNLTILNMLVTPSSRGTITLKSANPADPPILDPNVLNTQTDAQLLYAVTRQTSRAIERSFGSTHGATEYAIDESIAGDYSESAMRKRTLRMVRTINHGSGGCAMGSVVDGECKVFGVEGLRVIDSSIFPFPLGAHYQAAVYAVAEKMADLLA